MEIPIRIPKPYLFMLNQLFEIEQKLDKLQEENSIRRNINRLKNYFETNALSEGQGLTYRNPIGEDYDETRNDCEASIAGNLTEDLHIVEVMKPIIYVKYGNSQLILQKAIVIVQSKK
jgi:hypothetical protein